MSASAGQEAGPNNSASATGAAGVGRVGLVVGGRYTLEEFLGKGAMGEVWRARHSTLGSLVAIKLVSAGGDQETVTRLDIEARAAASIHSPNIVRIFDHGHDGEVAYIAMELLVGETLAARLRRLKKLTPHATALVIRDVAQGMAIAHRAGIIHRDLKPENVFLARTDQGECAKVLDFGIAKSLSMPTGLLTQQNIVVGTPAYLSREQVLGGSAIDAQADLWALGILVYETLTGRLPYAAATMAELFVQIVGGSSREQAARASDVPFGFGPWFLRATHPDPTQRFADARDLSDSLTRVLAPDLSILPWVIGQAHRAAPNAKSKRGLHVAAGLGVLAVFLCVMLLREAMKTRPTATPRDVAASATPTLAPLAPEALIATATTSASLSSWADVTMPQASAPAEPPPRQPSASSAPSASASVSTSAAVSGSAPPSATPSSRKPNPKYNRWGL